jgi:hypothetical protein
MELEEQEFQDKDLTAVLAQVVLAAEAAVLAQLVQLL